MVFQASDVPYCYASIAGVYPHEKCIAKRLSMDGKLVTSRGRGVVGLLPAVVHKYYCVCC